jgi:hypothetical protein
MFDFFIANTGTLNANAVHVRMYLDDQFQGLMTLGMIPANASGTASFSFRLGGNHGGSRTMRLTTTTSTPVSNFDNNTTSRTFRWQVVPGFVDLQVEGINNLVSGNNPFIATNPQIYSAVVYSGGTLSAISTNAEFSIDGQIVSEFYIGTMPPSYWIELRWTINLVRSGSYRFQVTARDRSLNTGSSHRTFVVLPDGCGVWSRTLVDGVNTTRNISIQVDHPNITPVDFVRDAANEWNNISSNIHISTVGTNLAGTPTVNIWTRNLADQAIGGYFSPNTERGNFTGGYIAICSTSWFNAGSGHPWRKHIIVHEIGHLLGLSHPFDLREGMGGNAFCRDFAAMQYPPLSTANVTAHDRAALRRQHGN